MKAGMNWMEGALAALVAFMALGFVFLVAFCLVTLLSNSLLWGVVGVAVVAASLVFGFIIARRSV